MVITLKSRIVNEKINKYIVEQSKDNKGGSAGVPEEIRT